MDFFTLFLVIETLKLIVVIVCLVNRAHVYLSFVSRGGRFVKTLL